MSDHSDDELEVLEALDWRPDFAGHRWLDVSRMAMQILAEVNAPAHRALQASPAWLWSTMTPVRGAFSEWPNTGERTLGEMRTARQWSRGSSRTRRSRRVLPGDFP